MFVPTRRRQAPQKGENLDNIIYWQLSHCALSTPGVALALSLPPSFHSPPSRCLAFFFISDWLMQHIFHFGCAIMTRHVCYSGPQVLTFLLRAARAETVVRIFHPLPAPAVLCRLTIFHSPSLYFRCIPSFPGLTNVCVCHSHTGLVPTTGRVSFAHSLCVCMFALVSPHSVRLVLLYFLPYTFDSFLRKPTTSAQKQKKTNSPRLLAWSND